MMASTVNNGNDRLRKGNRQQRPVAHGDLVLPLSDQGVLVFASNICPGRPGFQGFRELTRCPTTFLVAQPCILVRRLTQSQLFKSLYIIQGFR